MFFCAFFKSKIKYGVCNEARSQLCFTIRFPLHTPHYPLFRKCISYHVSFSVTGYDHDSAVGILDLINDRKSSFFFYKSFRALDLRFNDFLLRMTIAATIVKIPVMQNAFCTNFQGIYWYFSLYSDFFHFHFFPNLIFAFCHSLKCHGKKLRKLPAQLICTSLDHISGTACRKAFALVFLL